MSLEASGSATRVKQQTKPGQSKVDRVLAEMKPKDSDHLRGWLEDQTWTSHAITKALGHYSRSEGADFTLGHATIDRWRILNGVEVDQ